MKTIKSALFLIEYAAIDNLRKIYHNTTQFNYFGIFFDN